MRRGLVAYVMVAFLAPGCGGGVDAGGDADGDGVTNGDEEMDSSLNTDGDEFEDWLDLDADGDGIPDAIEAGDAELATPPVDTDGDGTPDLRDLDSDDDGAADTDELGPDFAPVDTDGDGAFDFVDVDSDGDTIRDATERAPERDSDGDGTPDFRDPDADGDGLPDAIEAGDAELATPPVDTDGDAIPDYLDLDADADGLPDAVEDPNGNGAVDPGESSPTSSDTDGDGTPDLVEVVAGTDPSDPGSNVPAEDFFFILPYQGPGGTGDLAFSTTLRQADVFFSVDTTGSFGEEIAAIQDSIETTIVPAVSAVIPNPAFGVGRFEDFPLDPFGLAGDRPYELLQPPTTDVALLTAAVDALPPASGGLDTPEAGYEALFQWATGAGFPAFAMPAFSAGDVGGAGFRADSLPIIIQITDARSHLPAEYVSFAADAHGEGDAIAALDGIGARVIGINSLENTGTPEDPRLQLEALAVASNALIPPAGGVCATGVDGAPLPPVDVGGTPMCPLVFDVRPDGTGLGDLIADAIAELASYGTLDISARAAGKLAGENGETLPAGTTTADFITSITPVPPPPPGATIDGDVFRGVTPGSTVLFRLDAFNDFVPETDVDQLFTIDVEVIGDGVTTLDVRQVYVIVPRRIDQPPVL
jgi:hypothetical protein